MVSSLASCIKAHCRRIRQRSESISQINDTRLHFGRWQTPRTSKRPYEFRAASPIRSIESLKRIKIYQESRGHLLQPVSLSRECGRQSPLPPMETLDCVRILNSRPAPQVRWLKFQRVSGPQVLVVVKDAGTIGDSRYGTISSTSFATNQSRIAS